MLTNSKKVFDMYMEEKGLNENRIAVMKGVYKKLSRWEISKNKSIQKATKDELIDLCKSGTSKIANRSYGAMKTRVDAINDILKWLKVDIKLSMTDFNAKEILTDSKIRYFTREEMQDICDIFINAQDKFIVYGLFSGIYGKGYSDILNLKVEDIDMENRLIHTPSGKVIEMDDYLFNVVRDTIDPVFGRTYYKYLINGTEGSTTSYYDLEMSCPYVIKCKPYSKNNNGQDPMKVNGIQRRLNKLAEVLNIDLREDEPHFSLSGTDIYRSGIMVRMNKEEIEKGIVWTYSELEKWLKRNGIKAQVFELYRLYHNKYDK